MPRCGSTLLEALSVGRRGKKISAELAPGAVDVRLRGGSAGFVVTPPPARRRPGRRRPVTRPVDVRAPVAEGDDAAMVRITLPAARQSQGPDRGRRRCRRVVSTPGSSGPPPPGSPARAGWPRGPPRRRRLTGSSARASAAGSADPGTTTAPHRSSTTAAPRCLTAPPARQGRPEQRNPPDVPLELRTRSPIAVALDLNCRRRPPRRSTAPTRSSRSAPATWARPPTSRPPRTPGLSTTTPPARSASSPRSLAAGSSTSAASARSPSTC